ncbi:DUF1194 domain-containing protein [Limobrevibacterium gyesilva]|uniref:DUF1194 domain-containing protein n=1 Tax=Limobrevibacterium gyesilva TaxID=2991712 RepID=A0AA41YNK1_9PROT|nr:DUF1194 domain-containing protein [Limobrevibacterium gyesilva]
MAGIAALLLGLAAGAAAQQPVDLQLVLGVDASGSVNQARFELQKRGYVAAFRNPLVLQAIRSGPTQAIAVAMVQWTGPALHVLVVDWMAIRDERSAEAVAAAIEAAPRRLFGGGTSISGMIDYGVALFQRGGFAGERRVIDISGDGANNIGRPAEDARDDAVRRGVTINGLPILTIEPDLDIHYRDQVIGGPGAFVIAIDSYDRFADAILRKLITEIATDARGAHATAQSMR